MKDELSYIDNITGEKLKNFVLKPETSWDTFNAKFKTVYNSGSFLSDIGGYFTTKAIVVSVVVILSILTAGILITNNNTDNVNELKGNTLLNNNKPNSNSFTVSPVDSVQETSEDNSDEKSTAEKDENIVINVEVPIYKKVVINKEVIISDTIHQIDSVR